MRIQDRPDRTRRKVFKECMESYGVGDRSDPWPNNMIATDAQCLLSGALVRRGVEHGRVVESHELERLKALADELVSAVQYLNFDIGSETSNPLWPYYVASVVDSKPRKRITEKLVRSWFGGTLFPPTTITIEPMAEKGVWWDEVVRTGGMEGEEQEIFLRPYREMIEVFGGMRQFVTTAFVRIGDCSLLGDLRDADFPAGSVIAPCVLPRMAIGMTPTGGAAGIFGYTVQT